MKLGFIAAATMLAAVAPGAGQAQEEPVKAGVDAWERGDYAAAVARWRGPAEQGIADAQFNLAQAYKTGRGVARDMALAEQWYRRAALQGHEQAEANYGLALFDNGKRAEAVQWLERAVARGDARAQYVLGVMLFNGDAVAKDWVRGYALVVRASESGLDVAIKARAQMDQFVPLDQRQQGAALARRYAEQLARGGMPVPPVTLVADAPASTRPAPISSPPAAAPARATPPATAAARPKPAAAPAREGSWRVQLGAFGDPDNARRLWAQVRGRFPGRDVQFVKAGRLTRVLVGPYSSQREAQAACARTTPCIPTR